MEFELMAFSVIVGGILIVLWLLKRTHEWFYVRQLGDKKHVLPPGDLGWPMLGSMGSFLCAFKFFKNPESFITGYVNRYGRIGIYKTFMFGNPTIIITNPKLCRQILMDEDTFGPGWPISTQELMGKKSFVAISQEEHKRLRKITATPINGYEALSVYLKYIEEIVVSTLEKWSTMGEFEFLTHMRKLTFNIIMYIFLSEEGNSMMEALEKEYTTLNYGLRALAIKLPGFAFYKANKARKRLVDIFQSAVTERRAKREKYGSPTRKDMLDSLLDVEDGHGRKLDDEEIIDLLVMYLNAGHESSGHLTMWATIFLQEHPDVFDKAKAEQEDIVKNRPSTQKGLTLGEIRKMTYLSNVIDETLRVINISLMVFREAKKDVTLNGYLIPRGWKIQVWLRSVHLDPVNYAEAKKFNPSRWAGYTPEAGTFLPFGAGPRLCPGNDLAKLEISIFLHYFLLNYRLERSNPNSPVIYLPHTRPTDNCLGRIKKNLT